VSGAAALGLAVADVEDGEGGQVRQDLVFPDVGLGRPGSGRVALVWPWRHR